MSKHKVSELEGALLDAAVARADGLRLVDRDGRLWEATPNCDEEAAVAHDDYDWETRTAHDLYSPGEDWSHGGPIIERERMCIQCPDVIEADLGRGQWSANVLGSGGRWQQGPTLLVAAMRAYVAAKFGDEVEL